MAAIDDFSGFTGGLDSPARHALAVTPSDTLTLAHVSRSLYIGVSGDVNVITVGGETTLFKAVPVGILPVRVSQVMAAGTTAASIVALY